MTPHRKLEIDVMDQRNQFHLVIPTGTKVLTRARERVGVGTHIPSTPEHSYHVRFPDGPEETFGRAELTIFKHVEAEVPGGPESADLYRFVIYRCNCWLHGIRTQSGRIGC